MSKKLLICMLGCALFTSPIFASSIINKEPTGYVKNGVEYLNGSGHTQYSSTAYGYSGLERWFWENKL